MRSIKRTLKERIAYLRLLAGDTDAFGFLYDQYSPKIYRFVYFKTSDREAAQDITHDVFLQAWETIVERKLIENFQAFIFKVARNKVIDHYRRASRQAVLLDDMKQLPLDTATAEAAAELHVAWKHLQELKDEYQEVIILRHVEGLSIDEISHVIEKDKNNVRVTLHRALTKLKELSQRDAT